MFHPEYIDPKKLITNDDIYCLFKLVEKHGGILRFVGGAVRDAITGYPRQDIDLVTDMSPAEFSDMCADEGIRCVPIGIQFFTTGVIINNSFFKITSLSSEEDNGHDEWELDASKRDLTINAVYADEKGNVFDYYNGINDLEKGIIKFIGNPQKTIENDYIRIMRFFRFCAMFGRNIDKKSLKACIENKELLKKTSAEKIKEELFKILMAPYAVDALKLIFDNAILDFLVAPPKSLDNLSKLENLVKKLHLQKSIIRRIYVLFSPDVKRASRLADIFKLDKKQKSYLQELAQARLSLKNFKDSVSINQSLFKYGKDICCDKWLTLNLDTPDIEKIKSVLNTLSSSEVPCFPLTGKKLISAGAESKMIGFYMDVLKKYWFEHGCIMSEAELVCKFKDFF